MYVSTVFLLVFIISFADSEKTTQDIFTDLSQTTCTSKRDGILTNTFFYYLDLEESPVPHCQEYDESYHGIQCLLDQPTITCAAGYNCIRQCTNLDDDIECVNDDICKAADNRSRCRTSCRFDPQSCMGYHAKTEDFDTNLYTALKFKPICLNDGTWAPKQCKGGVSGRCFCFDKVGKRLFGQAPYRQSSDMTCACSRKKAELLASGRNYVSFHCDSLGNFEELQCDSDLCWCADPKTGDPTSPIVPDSNMALLPCYNADKVGSQYLRQCDSEKYAQAKIGKYMSMHGVTTIMFRMFVCDDDGAFGVYTVKDGKANCLRRDGTNISPYQIDMSGIDFADMNCNCARDHEMGYSSNLICRNNGNYQAMQRALSGGTYCVDLDGNEKSDVITSVDIDCAKFY